jgi:ABC-type Mn2+/Zn2+ transport system permease subunit
MMALSWLFATAFSVSGLMVGWTLDIPVGATVVVIAGAVFLGAAGARLVRTYLVKRNNQLAQHSPAKEPRKS